MLLLQDGTLGRFWPLPRVFRHQPPQRQRGVATHDKLAVRFQAVLTIAIINEWI
ncbi:hypothetical protein AB0L86_18300 [Micromonospora musae]|uniref:hypothetical protein n=1 Tax=Micromonospora musae TaxID=1894970 RepID=UPI003432D6EE